MADLTYLSFGAGVQSTALLILSNKGLHGVPRADVAYFADTGYEPAWVYENVERMTKWSEIPVEIVRGLDMRPGRIISKAPLWTKGKDGEEAPLRRQCTGDYKIDPIARAARARIGRGKKTAVGMVGISWDEFHRMKPSTRAWITNIYPLVDAKLTRQDCKRIIAEAGLPIPHRSSCTFCPFHTKDYFRAMRDNFPAEWEKLLALDDGLDSTIADHGVKGTAYITRELKRLRDVDLDKGGQQEFGWANECGGICGL